MPQLCLYTLEPVEYGGVPDKVHFAHDLITKLGHDIKLVYLATNRVPSGSRLTKLKYFLQTAPFNEIIYGMRGYGIPDYPLPAWLMYFAPLLFARQLIQQSQMHFAISGSNHVALPSAILRQPFLVWIGTQYEEEIVGKAIGGDPWAVKMMNSPLTRKLLAWEEKFIFNRATLILTNGKHTADAVTQFAPQAESRVRVLMFPVDETRFKPDPTQRQNDTPYLLFTARINEPRKNTALLIRAFARVYATYPNLRLVLTGDPPNEQLLATAQAANIQNQIDFLGYQTPEQLIKLYQGAELFIVPSLQEGMCNALLEALACGIPAISTKCGGPEKAIIENETGYLVANNNEDEMVNAILKTLGNPAHLETMRHNARQYALNHYARPIAEKILRDALHTVYPQYF